MPIQDPHATLKRQSGGPTTYTPRPFDEPQPTAPARKPPVLQQHDRKDFPSNSQYQKAVKAANDQYERENGAYAIEKQQYDKDIQGWRDRKAAWDAGENDKVKGSGAGQERLVNYLQDPKGQSQLDWNAGAMVAPMPVFSLLSTGLGRGMRGPITKLGFGAAELGAGEYLRDRVQQTQPDKYENPEGYYRNQMWQNAALSSGIGAALGSVRSAAMKPKQPAGATSPEPTPPQAPPVEPYKGNPRDVARYIAHDLGLTPTSKESKADTIANALGQIKSGNATKEQMELVAQRARGIEPTTILERIAKSNKPLAATLGALGLGAAAAVGAPGEAEAAAPREQAVRKPPEETSSDFSDLEREFGTGLPKGKAREVLKSAADTALYQAPVAGEARMALDAPSLYKPSDEDLADAEYWQRGREEMAQPHAAGGSAFNPEHLPEHERSLLHDPEQAHERAKWILPYVRAGAEAQRRGEDFFGGSPEYENQLTALKHFYHGKPQAPTAEEAPTAPEGGFKHGGAVNRKSNPHLKQMNSIHDTFKTKLADKERMIASLEKAVARKPNAKLSKRLSKEKSEAQRIHEHLQKIMTHG